MTLICGIDEAGRGPVLGPLVICGVVIEEKDSQKLKDIGAKDSKLLTAKQREALVDQIKKIAKAYKLIHIEPAEIEAAVSGEESNLNWLEADKAVELINALKPDEVFMDCPSTNIPKFTEYMVQKFKHKTALRCAHHADRDFPVVSAASILAKVARDAEIEKIKKKIGVNVGSGYPADPVTKAFLEKCWNKYPALFRHSWESYKREVRKIGQEKLDKF